MNHPNDIAKAAGARRVLDLTGATAGLDFSGDHCLRCGMAFGLNFGPDACNCVVEAITDRTLILAFLEINRDSQLALLDLIFPGIIDDRAVAFAAKFVFLGAKFGSLDISFCHRAHGGKGHRLTLFTAAGAEVRIFLISFTDRTAVR